MRGSQKSLTRSFREAAHFKRNCSESMLPGRKIASGSCATASMMEFSTGLITEFVSDWGSFSQLKSAPSASGVAIVDGSDM